MVVRVLPIFDCNSDGDSSKWPTADKGYKRNDEYFLQRIANDFWAKDRDHNDLGGPPSSATWRLDRLPDGYAGFEKSRPDLKHVDRSCTVIRGASSGRSQNFTHISSI
jgi:hypothetical protein